MKGERNYSIDLLKFICAVLIVFLHTSCIYHKFIDPITRCAVPCFFIISGYLLYNKDGINPKRLKRNLIHILNINIGATILFALIKEVLFLRQGEIYIPTSKELFNFLLFNENPFMYHLWYLSAYLYVLIIIYFINKYKVWKYLFYLIPILLLSDCIFGKYSLLLFNKEFPTIYVRNFICVGIPYFAMGALIKKTTSYIPQKTKLWGIGIFIFSLTSIAEETFLWYIDKDATRTHYISTTFLSICLFLFMTSYKTKSTRFSTSGEKDSLYIYLFHPLFIWILSYMIYKHNISIIIQVYNWIAPFVILGITILFIYLIRKIHLIK